MRRSSASSARGKPARKRGLSTARARRVDFSGIPEATDEQLRVMRRVGRPPIGTAPRQLIAIRLDPRVLQRLKREARQRQGGYPTLLNRDLRGPGRPPGG